MRVRTIDPPQPVVTVAEARRARVFTEDDDDGYITAMLEVAQSQIDGWDGWLGRAIGVQTVEVTLPASCSYDVNRLPLPPYDVTTLVDTLSDDGLTRTLQYEAGYEDAVPPAIKHAIILMAGMLRDVVPDDKGSLKRKTIDGVGSFDYSLPDGAAEAMQKVAESLLAPYRVFSV